MMKTNATEAKREIRKAMVATGILAVIMIFLIILVVVLTVVMIATFQAGEMIKDIAEVTVWAIILTAEEGYLLYMLVTLTASYIKETAKLHGMQRD